MPRFVQGLIALVGCLLTEPILGQSLDDARAMAAAGRATEALDAYRSVAAASASTDPATSGIAHNNACVLLIDLGDYPAAYAECSAALSLRRRGGEDRGLARTLNNLGLALQHLGRYAEAAATTQEALMLNRTRGDTEGEAVNQNNLTGIAILAGRYGDALAHLQEVVALTALDADEPWAEVQSDLARINQGVVLEHLGAYGEALETYRDLLDNESTLSARYRATLRVNTGTLYRNLGDAPRAAEQFADAVARWTEVGDTAALANAKLNLALVLHRNLRRLAEAEPVYREALSLAEKSGDRGEQTMILLHLGDLLVESDRLGEAESTFAGCLARAEASGSVRGRWSALAGLAQIDARRGDRDTAIARLRTAIELIEGVRAGVDRPSLRATYFRGQRQVFERAIALLADLAATDPTNGSAADAFALVQQAKVRELVEALGGRGRIAGPGRQAEVQAALGSATLISFFQANDRLLRWTLTRDAARLDDLGSAASFAQAVVDLHQSLEAGAEPAYNLIERLAPLVPPQAIAETDRLYVAPDGLLHYLPFELLLVHAATTQAAGDPTVIYLPSASTLLVPTTESTLPTYQLVGFADPTLPVPETAPLTPFGLFTARYALPRLEHAAAELHDVAARIGGPTWIAVGNDATEAAFYRWAPTGRVLHLATHTVVEERGANRAAVLLAASPEQDGLLFPEEISSLGLAADLAVLAACRTALGPQGDGRGLSSLTGAFLAAGTRAVIATLWDVGDQATAVFMQQLYHELRDGKTPAEAVHQVKRRLRADPRWSHPSLWAAFVVIGDAPPVVGRPAFGRRLWLVIVALLTAAFVGQGLRRRKGRGRIDRGSASATASRSSKGRDHRLRSHPRKSSRAPGSRSRRRPIRDRPARHPVR